MLYTTDIEGASYPSLLQLTPTVYGDNVTIIECIADQKIRLYLDAAQVAVRRVKSSF